MTPLELARILAADTDNPRAQAAGAAIIARGLSDESPSDPFRQPWPVDVSIERAIEYLGLTPSPALTAATRAAMADVIVPRG